MNLYECIFYRKSVRKYIMEEPDKNCLENIKKFIEHVEFLYAELPIAIEIMSNEERGKSFHTNFLTAPYYLEAKAGTTEEDFLNVGFVMEQISLYLIGKGLGSCFIGGKDALFLAFGKAAESKTDQCKKIMNLSISDPARREYSKAKRQRLDKLCVYKEPPTKEVKILLEAARLAPSAWNVQPWRFVAYQNRIHIFCKKSGVSEKIKRERYLSIGVMLSHVFLAAEELWLEMDVKKLDHMAEKMYQKNDYVLTLMLK